MRHLFRLLRVQFFSLIGKITIGKYTSPPFCGGFCKFTKNTYVGKNTNFNGMKINGAGRVFIGDNFHSGSECQIITQNHNFEGQKIPYDESYLVKDVRIGDNVWFGNRIIILPGVTIGEGAIIQAGSVVVSDIPKLSIAGGHPAKVFSHRDKDRYHKLKIQGKFH